MGSVIVLVLWVRIMGTSRGLYGGWWANVINYVTLRGRRNEQVGRHYAVIVYRSYLGNYVVLNVYHVGGSAVWLTRKDLKELCFDDPVAWFIRRK